MTVPRWITLFVVVSAAPAAAWLLWRPLLGQHPLGPPPRSTDPAVIYPQLGSRFPEVDFEGQELRDSIDLFSDLMGCSMVVDWNALESAGVRRGARVSLHLPRGTRAGESLDLILSHVGDQSVPLAYAIDDGYVMISTRADIDHGKTIRGYDVTELVARETDPLVLAFGWNPFRVADPSPQERADQLSRDLRARFGPTDVPDDPKPLFHKGDYPKRPTLLVAYDTRPRHREIEAYLDRAAWWPGAKAFALRTAALSAAALAGVRLAFSPARRRRRLRRQNRCTTCGYDLRASAGRCPECGLAAAVTSKIQAAAASADE